MASTNSGERLRQSMRAPKTLNIHTRYCELISESAIKKEEKDHIKTRALQAGVVEPAPLLALHNSLMIAKIMRYEFPAEWCVEIPSPSKVTSIDLFVKARWNLLGHCLPSIVDPAWREPITATSDPYNHPTNYQRVVHRQIAKDARASSKRFSGDIQSAGQHICGQSEQMGRLLGAGRGR